MQRPGGSARHLLSGALRNGCVFLIGFQAFQRHFDSVLSRKPFSIPFMEEPVMQPRGSACTETIAQIHAHRQIIAFVAPGDGQAAWSDRPRSLQLEQNWGYVNLITISG
jgi:hypothetical protein